MIKSWGFLWASVTFLAALTVIATTVPPSASPVTWTQDIAPVVYQSCAECHHPGGPGPFSLLTYVAARRHARQIAEVTESRLMPPWLPDAASGPFVHARHLSEAQIALFRRWAAAGAPQGDVHALPSPPTFSDGWRLGRPDQIVRMPQLYTLPPETSSPYRAFVLPVAAPFDRLLRAIEFRSNTPVIRHAALYVDTTGTARKMQADSGAVGYEARDAGLGSDAQPLAEWSVASEPYTLPRGAAVLLPAHADLVLLLRFEPDGQKEDIQPQIGLYDTPSPVMQAPLSLTLGARDLIMDPGQKATVTDAFTLPVAVRLLRVTPHGHPVCRTLRVSADGDSLLHIGDWNADWPDSYRFAAPPVLSAGTRLTVYWTADNTAANPRNPMASPMTVMPGLLYLDDMATVRFEMVPVNPADAPRLLQAVRSPRPEAIVLTTAADRHG